MSWCDKLASTPAAGFKLDWHFASASSITQALTPILDQLVADNKPKFTMSSVDQFAVSVAAEDGFTYGIDPSGINVVFQHRMKATPVSAGPPVMEMLSRPMPFTKLLPDVFDRLVRATLLVTSSNKGRGINRVGIVSTTVVAEDELPPGIERYVKYMSRPWSVRSENFHLQITTSLGTDHGSNWTDYCTHVVAKQEGDDGLVVLTFDWYRTFKTKKPINEDSLQDMLKKPRVLHLIILKVSEREASLMKTSSALKANRNFSDSDNGSVDHFALLSEAGSATSKKVEFPNFDAYGGTATYAITARLRDELMHQTFLRKSNGSCFVNGRRWS